jgi:hypothetical protein
VLAGERHAGKLTLEIFVPVIVLDRNSQICFYSGMITDGFMKKIITIAVLASVIFAGNAFAQIFVVGYLAGSTNTGYTILVFNFDGTYQTSYPILDPSSRAIASDGTYLYVAGYDNYGVVGKYTKSGVVVNPSMISGLSHPSAMTVSGTNLFVFDNNRIGIHHFRHDH